MQGEVAAREETFKVEEQAIAAVGALAADLRRSLDKVTHSLRQPLPSTCIHYYLCP